MDWQVTEQTGRVTLTVRRHNDGKGLYKAWLVGGGGRCLLGTMTPSGTMLTLVRQLDLRTLQQHGHWPILRVEEELAFPFRPPNQPPPGWHHPPQIPLRDPILRQALERAAHPIYRTDLEGFTLAFPYSPQHPFPLTPLFCLGWLTVVGGRLRVLFAFTPEGIPRPPTSQGPI